MSAADRMAATIQGIAMSGYRLYCLILASVLLDPVAGQPWAFPPTPILDRPQATLRWSGLPLVSIAMSPGGRLLATADADGSIQIWEVATSRLVRTLKKQGAWVQGLAFSPDGTRLASACDSGTVKVWDMENSKEIATLRGHRQEVKAVAFAPGGTRVAAGGKEETVRVWGAADRRPEVVFLGHVQKPDSDGMTFSGRVTSLAFSPDGRRVASSSRIGLMRNCKLGWVKVWDAASGKEFLVIEESADLVVFSPDSRRLATSNWDGAALRDASSGKLLAGLPVQNGDVEAIAFAPGGRCLAVVAAPDMAEVWDVKAGKRLVYIERHNERLVAFDSRRGLLAIVTGPKTVEVWDVANLLGAGRER
jgi:WD40 repeat protein